MKNDRHFAYPSFTFSIQVAIQSPLCLKYKKKQEAKMKFGLFRFIHLREIRAYQGLLKNKRGISLMHCVIMLTFGTLVHCGAEDTAS